LPRPLPEGSVGLTEPVYDCVVYLIYCAVHDRIAVTNVDKAQCVWLPFVPLPEGVTWEKASHDGVATLIGRQDAEMDAEAAARTTPIYQMSYLHILRLQMASSQRMVARVARFIHLQPSEHWKCCQNSPRIHWIPAGDILANRVER